MDEEMGWESGGWEFMRGEVLESRCCDCKEGIVVMGRESGGCVRKGGGDKGKR